MSTVPVQNKPAPFRAATFSSPSTTSRVALAKKGSAPAAGDLRRASEDVGDDEWLMNGVARGNHSSLARLYDLYASSAMGLATKICGCRTLADDVVQEVFIAIWQSPARFDSGRGTARAFLMGMVHHKAIDAIRRETSIQKRETQFASEMPKFCADTMFDSAWISVRRQRVGAALQQLSQVQREALELAYLEGLTYCDVAARLCIPLGTAKTRIRDGMIRLTTLLTPDSL